MRGRDVAVLGAVLVLGGLTLADALRDGGEGDSSPARTPTASAPVGSTREPEAQPEAPGSYRRGKLRGVLLFTDARNCRLRAFDLSGGRERPLAPLEVHGCEFWPAPGRVGWVAYELGPDRFTPVDISGSYLGVLELLGSVIWSLDGERAAWCASEHSGYELEPPDPNPRRLRRCPSAYSLNGELAYPALQRLVVGKRTILRTPTHGAITSTWWGADGSILVLVEPSERLERWKGGRLSGSLQLGGSFERATPIPSPDNCAVAFADPGSRVTQVLDLGCFRGPSPQTFLGHAAAWSPDGEWLAVAEAQRIAFHYMLGEREVLSWPSRAAKVYWRER